MEPPKLDGKIFLKFSAAFTDYATLKSIDYNVAMTFILNNNNNNINYF